LTISAAAFIEASIRSNVAVAGMTRGVSATSNVAST
jgi:hypothetical protein